VFLNLNLFDLNKTFELDFCLNFKIIMFFYSRVPFVRAYNPNHLLMGKT